MYKRVIGFIIVIIVVVGAVIGFNVHQQHQSQQAASNSSPASATKTVKTKVKTGGKVTMSGTNHKILIVYFSRRKGVAGGTLKVGNTARVAGFIQQHTNGDTYEIVPKKTYPSGNEATNDLGQKEQQENARPAIKNAIPNVKQYDTVFIGAPIWWGEYPMIVRTFMDNVDLNGKTVIPFTTSEGSGLGNTTEALHKAYPHARVRKGFTAEGNAVRDNPSSIQPRVDKWLSRLGY